MPDDFTPPGKAAESTVRMDRILALYRAETGSSEEDGETVVIDFLADLRHWVTDASLSWSYAVEQADMHWAAETESPEAE